MRLITPTRLIARDEPGRYICRLCFGEPINQRQIQYDTYIDTIQEFLPQQVFGVIWWQRHEDGRQHRAAAVVEACKPTAIGFQLPCLSRDVIVHAMVDQHGPAGEGGAVDRFLIMLHQVRESGHIPSQVPPIIYRCLSYVILSNQRIDTTKVLQCLKIKTISNN